MKWIPKYFFTLSFMVCFFFTCAREEEQDFEQESIEIEKIEIKVDFLTGKYKSLVVGDVFEFKPQIEPAGDYVYAWKVNGKLKGSGKEFIFNDQELGEYKIELNISAENGVGASEVVVSVLKKQSKKVVGYIPYWRDLNLRDDIGWNKLTHVCYAFLQAKSDGSTDDSKIRDNIDAIVSESHKNGVALLVSIGGGGAEQFSDAILDESHREKLAQEIADYVEKHHLDGADIDYEQWDGSSKGGTNRDLLRRAALEDLYKILREKMGPDKLLTAAVSASWIGNTWGNYNCYTNTMSQYLDFIGIMIYDQTGTWDASPFGQHAAFEEHYIPSIDHWLNNRDLPKEKLIAGVPFYGMKFKTNAGGVAEGIGFKDIVNEHLLADPMVYLKDTVGLTIFNGVETIRKKSQYVVDQNLGGIMIWELTHDLSHQDDRSLLKNIDQVIKGKN